MIFDTALEHSAAGDLARLEANAASEAANTGGTVVRVLAVEVRGTSVLLVGTIPSTAVEDGGSHSGRILISPRSLGTLHLSEAVNDQGPMGFLVVHHPVKLMSGELPDDTELVGIGLEVPRCGTSLEMGLIGSTCCSRCNQPIPVARLQAIPGTTTCVRCQILKEKK